MLLPKLLVLACLPCLIFSKFDSDESGANPFEQLQVGYNGKSTPSCVDGTIYATSRSSCEYPRNAIEHWIRKNPVRMEDLYRNVPVGVKQPQNGVFPKHVEGVESCNYVEDYPELRWVYSFDDGWLPVVQTDRYKQFYRLEFCTSPKCSNTPGGKCKTFESRTQVLAWNGKEVVGTTVLLQTSCKCVLEGAGSESNEVDPGYGVAPPLSDSVCNPYTDCDCDCPAGDSNCFIHRRLVCAGDVVPAPIYGGQFVPYWHRRHHYRHHRRYRRHHSRSGSHSGSDSHSRSDSHRRSDSHDRSGSHSRSDSHRRSGSSDRSDSHSRSHSHDRSDSHRHSSSGSGSHERSCDPYTECSCPCGNYRTRRHCLDYRRRNYICPREQYEGQNDWGYIGNFARDDSTEW